MASGPTRPAGTQLVDPRVDEILALLRARDPVAVEAPASLKLGELWERIGPGWLARVKPKTQKNTRTLFISRVLPRRSVDEIRNANLSKWYESVSHIQRLLGHSSGRPPGRERISWT